MKGIVVPSSRITPKEAAEILGIKPVTVYSYISQGKLKAYRKSNNKLYLLREDVEEFKASTETVTAVVPTVSEQVPISGKDIGMKTIKGYLMTVAEVATFLRVSKRWLEMHLNNGTFPIKWYSIRTRGRVFDSMDVEEWLSKMFVNAGSAPLPLKRRAKNGSKEVAVKR